MRGKRGDFDGDFSGSKNETGILDLFLRVSRFGNAVQLKPVAQAPLVLDLRRSATPINWQPSFASNI
jgi:hypothetical protein